MEGGRGMRIKLVEQYVFNEIGDKSFKKDHEKKCPCGYRFFHSKMVVNIMLLLLDKIPETQLNEEKKKEIQRNKELIIIAGLLHDIKRDDKNHGLVAAKMVDQLNDIMTAFAVERNTSWDALTDEALEIIREMVLKHNVDELDKTNSDYVKLMQDSDKIFKYARNIRKECNDNYFTFPKEEVKLYLKKKKKVKRDHKNLNYPYALKLLEDNMEKSNVQRN